MRDYEGLFILKPDLAKEELSGLITKVQDNIKKYKGTIDNAEEKGKRPLTFKLKKSREGLYYLVNFKIEPSQIAALNSDLRLNESVLRVMFTQKQS